MPHPPLRKMPLKATAVLLMAVASFPAFAEVTYNGSSYSVDGAVHPGGHSNRKRRRLRPVGRPERWSHGACHRHRTWSQRASHQP